MSRNAVVIGGGLAGLLAARVLLEHAGKVTVIERDRFPAEPEFRKGVPQGRHLHIFLSSGQRALDELLPGAGAELAAAGARRLEIPRDLLTRETSGWQRRYHEGRHTLVSCTRPLLDHVVRTRVLADAGDRLEVLQAHEAVGLLGSAERVTGVRVRSRDGERAEQELSAELVVDASGRGSQAPEWLRALGRQAPREESVDAGLAYATQLLRLPAPPDAGIYIKPAPARGGVLLPVEGGDWLLTLSGMRGEHPPTDEHGFLGFAAGLSDPYIHDLVKSAEPLTPVHGFRNTGNRLRHYHKPGGVPEGFIAVSDAACTFNPVYGQGMSVAALGAITLRDTLADGGLRPGFAPVAQRAVARAAELAWLTAVGADRRHAEGAATSPSLTERLQSRYFARLADRAAIDPAVGAVFRDVVSLSAPLSRLTSPPVALRTLFLPRRPALSAPPLAVEGT